MSATTSAAMPQAFPVIPVLTPGCVNPPTGFLKLLTWIDLSGRASILDQQDQLNALRRAILGEQVESALIRDAICPYRGLVPFFEEDAAFFCGRAEAIDQLAAQVSAHNSAHNFVAVVGPSGSGKSSLVFAGLPPGCASSVNLRCGTSSLSIRARSRCMPWRAHLDALAKERALSKEPVTSKRKPTAFGRAARPSSPR
jgi:hypothetical protein